MEVICGYSQGGSVCKHTGHADHRTSLVGLSRPSNISFYFLYRRLGIRLWHLRANICHAHRPGGKLQWSGRFYSSFLFTCKSLHGYTQADISITTLSMHESRNHRTRVIVDQEISPWKQEVDIWPYLDNSKQIFIDLMGDHRHAFRLPQTTHISLGIHDIRRLTLVHAY